MPQPYALLPSIDIPAHITREVDLYDVTWSQREVVNIVRPAKPTAFDERRFEMTETLCAFLDEACKGLHLDNVTLNQDALLFFGEVHAHNDEPLYSLRGRPERFLHVIVKGEGTLRFPGLRNKALREIPLSPGVVFVMNPRLQHAVNCSEAYGIASLSSLVPYIL